MSKLDTESTNNTQTNTSHQIRLVNILSKIFADLLGIDVDEIDTQATFLELGADSLFLLQASQAIENELGIRIPFRLLLEDFDTIALLAAHINQNLLNLNNPIIEELDSESESIKQTPVNSTLDKVTLESEQANIQQAYKNIIATQEQPENTSTLERIMSKQLTLMGQQLSILQAKKGLQQNLSSSALPSQAKSPTPSKSTLPQENKIKQKQQTFTAYEPLDIKPKKRLNSQQEKSLADLIDRVTTKTKKSKDTIQTYRPVFADGDVPANFKRLWKELVYPIVVKHASGAKIWDVDDNMYVDLALGFGSLLYGHSPTFIIDALTEAMHHGIQLGSQNMLANKAAKLLCSLVGAERAIFVNSGTEAVMSALRLARAVSHRTKIVAFVGGYHGTFDGIMTKADGKTNGIFKVAPLAPGVPDSMLTDIILLEYGAKSSLEIIKTHASEIAAVLLEPIQSRRPELNPKEFLQTLREISTEFDIALIFDEVITGFRTHLGGMQAVFDVKADITTYGKAMGGGIPIAAIAGKAKYLDAIDGGQWQFGNDSYPETTTTFLAGTYFNHHFTTAAVYACLKHLKENSPALQNNLAKRTEYLTHTLNQYFEENNLALRVYSFSSWFKIVAPLNYKFMELFYYYLREKGVNVAVTRLNFLSTAHTDEDIEHVISAIKETVLEMQEADFLPKLDNNTAKFKKNSEVDANTEDINNVDDNRLPLTDGQKQLWALAQLGEDSSRAYNESLVLDLRGSFNATAMFKAIQQVVNRHDALRVKFSPLGDYQTFVSHLTLDIPLIDLSNQSSTQQDVQLNEHLQMETKVFDLVTGPLIRAKIIKLTQEHHILILTLHHIITDGWSNGILLREIKDFYNAFCQEKSLNLPKPMQFSHYINWQIKQQANKLAEAEAYWLKQFDKTTPVLELPKDKPRPATQSYIGSQINVTVDKKLYQSLKTFSVAQNCTLFVTLLAGFNIVLHRLTNQSEVVVGIPTAGQIAIGGKDLIGYCVNMLPLKNVLTDKTTVSNYLTNVKQGLLNAYEYQLYPFNQLIKNLGLAQDRSRPPLVAATFNLDVLKEGGSNFLKLETQLIPNHSQTAKFDIDLNINDTGQTLKLEFDYNSDLFNQETVNRWVIYFQNILKSMTTVPQQNVLTLPFLPKAEIEQLLQKWNNTHKPYPYHKCVHHIFEEQAKSTPDTIAVVFEDKTLTYHELNQKANQLASYLQNLGVKPETLVGLYIERSMEMLIGLLGILKSGGVYVPLDPTYPQERLTYMLINAQISILLTQQSLQSNLTNYQGKLLHLDSDWKNIASQPNQKSTTLVEPTNLAYVIYTSGSTGKPKGVQITHRSLFNFLKAMQTSLNVTKQDILLAVTTISFDISALELYLPLLVGGRIILASQKDTNDGLSLLKLLEQYDITMMQATPSTWQMLLLANWKGGLNFKILCGGEALPQELALNLLKNGKFVWNMYGPTETTIWSTSLKLENEQQNVNAIVPIGYSIANTQLYILDTYLQPVPIGVSGELYIGGLGLARGYKNHPALTAEKFIPNPFATIYSNGERLYKTGDLVRYLPDGNLEFLGRIDNQVKVHGFRIELGEIETALKQIGSVQESVVIVREDVPTKKYIVAYIIPKANQTPTPRDLHYFLKEKLPKYMVPTTFVMLQSFPLTPNGKINRKKLPKPEQTGFRASQGYVAPLTTIEKKLADLWKNILNLNQVGVYSNFFELGGDSIQAIQMVSQANQEGFKLSPHQIFRYPTIFELSKKIDTASYTQTTPKLVTGTIPLIPIQHWFFQQNYPHYHHFNQAVMFKTKIGLNPNLLQKAFEHLLIHHDALRLRFTQKNKQWQQVNTDQTEPIALIQIDLAHLSHVEQKNLIETNAAEIQASLNITTGPLLKCAFFHLGHKKAGRLFIVIHHLAVDIYSWQILQQDLETIYHQLEKKEAIKLPPKTTSFKHWAERLQHYANSKELKQELPHWLTETRQLVKPLPIDYSDGLNIINSEINLVVSLGKAETQAMLTHIPKVYRTQINDILLTALAITLSKWTKSQLVLVDVEGHGREPIFDDINLSRTVGWFTSIYPVLLDLRNCTSIEESIKTIKDYLRTIPNGGFGYSILQYLNSDPTISKQLLALPQAEVLFNYGGKYTEHKSEAKSLFSSAPESTGPAHIQEGKRHHLLEINAFISEGQFQAVWTYSENIYKPKTIKTLAEEFIKYLNKIISHSELDENKHYTSTDFPLAKLRQNEFEKLFNQINKVTTTPLAIEDIYPLSHLQQGMLFHTLYSPKESLYLVQFKGVLQGNLDIPTFKKAWQQIINRHSILRTAVFWEKINQPLQVVFEQIDMPIIYQDWQHLSEVEQQNNLQTYIQAGRNKEFNLSTPPLMHLAIFQIKPNIHYFMWTVHHILIDGWSVSPVLKDILDFYNALQSNTSLQFPLSRPFKDYIAWLQEQDLEQAKIFWQKYLKGFTTLTILDIDQKHTLLTEQETKYHSHFIRLPQTLFTSLRTFARQHHLTLNTIFQGLWALLLGWYSNKQDIVFGSVVSGRPANMQGIETMIGMFINTLPVRVNISFETSLITWLKELQLQQIETKQYEYAPLLEIQKWSEIPPGTALFESIFAFENYPLDVTVSETSSDAEQKSSLQLLSLETLEKDNYPLSIIIDSFTELTIRIKYDASRFEHNSIIQIINNLKTLLENLATNFNKPLWQLSPLTEKEQKKILVDWNKTQSPYPKDKCIQHLFEEQVNQTPQAIAVEFEDKQLTYQQLNEKANQLAHYLIKKGVGPEVLVGLCLERSSDMIIGLLAILKAGGVYLPLDPSYPPQRLSVMIQDADPLLLLTTQDLIDAFSTDTNIFCLDSLKQTLQTMPTNNPKLLGTGQQLVYVMYTSGSTGKPKGICITHQNIIRLVYNTNYISLDNSHVITQISNVSFDAAIFEIWGALLHGSTLVILQKEIALSPPKLKQALHDYKITTLFVTTALFHQLIQEDNDIFATLKYVLFGGEAATPKWIKLLLNGTPPQKLLNLYGPTESTTFSTWYSITDVAEEATSISIGRAVANTQIYILDNYLKPVPVNVNGELYIGGDGLARGYLNNPVLTAEKFIPNPYGEGRLYKTGDLACYLPDGNIEFIGRIDNQVKIRGFRIELDEIETTLETHPQIQEAIIIMKTNENGNKSLIAYIISNTEQHPTPLELQNFLESKLPTYMVLSNFVFLDKFPLNPNGKIDRQKLPEPQLDNLDPESFTLPRTSTEEILANIWCDVLKLDKVSVHDNFFMLGGDSIISIQIIAQARQAGLSLQPKHIFQHKTIAQLATVVNHKQHILAEQGLITGSIPLTPIQHWFFKQNLPERHYFNQSFLLKTIPSISADLLKQVVEQLILHHDALRLQFKKQNDEWQQINANRPQNIPFQVIDLSSLAIDKQRSKLKKIAIKLQSSFDLSSDCLIKVVLFNLNNTNHNWLLIIIHHLAVDGVSWRILLEDITTAYQQLTQNQPIQLPSKTTSFKTWANRLKEYANSQKLKAELTHWLQQQPHPLPVDYPEGHNTIISLKTITVSLSPTETQALLQQVPQAYNTKINDALLTALLLAFANWTGNHNLLINLEGHGREDLFDDIDLSRTVGWFTSIFPVMLTIVDNNLDDIGEILKSVKEKLRTIPKRGIGYGILRYLSSEKNKHTWVNPQISFNYLGQFDQNTQNELLLGIAREDIGLDGSGAGTRYTLLDINGLIINGQMIFNWTYSHNLHKSTTIKHLADSFITALQKIINHCSHPESKGYTPSDFPLANLNQNTLNQLTLQKSPIEDIYPLSPIQEGILFHSFYTLKAEEYFVQTSFTINGNFNPQNFKQAWQYLLNQHPILRTAFVWKDIERPLQIVYKNVELSYKKLNWQNLSPTKQKEKLTNLQQADLKAGFDLSKAPLIRLTIIQEATQRHHIIFSFHHILLDGWSLSKLHTDTLLIYQALNNNQSFKLPASPPYRHYIKWLQKQSLTESEKFWRTYLKGFDVPTQIQLKQSSSRPSSQKTYQTHHIKLSTELTTQLQNLAQQQYLTLNTIVQGCWALLLSYYSGQNDIVYGCVVSGRSADLSGLETMVGLFINTLPVRIKITHHIPLTTWLQNLQTQQTEIRQYEYTPLVNIQQWSDIPKGTPLFECLFVFENYPIEQFTGLNATNIINIEYDPTVERTGYPLCLTVSLQPQLVLNIIYDNTHFNTDIINTILTHLETLLKNVINNPTTKLGELSYLPQIEHHQIITKWNETKTNYPHNKCIHQLFENQVKHTPKAIAVVFEDKQLTYQQLNEQANQLAHYLINKGVGPEVLVGLCIERSLDMIVALLAILKSGGTYVPLDPSYPQERLIFILNDTQTDILLTTNNLFANLASYKTIINLDSQHTQIKQQAITNPSNQAVSQNLAYVMYTSGSTGKPKGISVTHQNVVRLVKETNYARLTAKEVFLQLAPVSFDASTLEIWGSLLNGAKLIIFPPYNPTLKELGKIIQQHQINILWLTSGLFNLMVEEQLHDLKPIKQLLAGGDVLSVWHVKKLLEELPKCQLINGYGPTENTTFTCCFSINNVDQISHSVPIGYPISNTQVYILNNYLQPVPIGVQGELYTSGDGLSRGYINQPKLTADKFIPNPYGKGRLYKTGDLARYLPDGSIEFIGRIDNQVKIRGFRIELGEIETVLSSYSQVKETIVTVKTNENGDKSLNAYIIPNTKQQPTIPELQDYLKNKLPIYMIPNNIIFLDKFPLTVNGKIDRKKLPDPTELSLTTSQPIEPPRNLLEKELLQIWEKLLEKHSIGIRDNFFELGGHSLLTVQLMTEINKKFGVEMPLSILFEYDTIAHLAHLLQQKTDFSQQSPLVTINPNGTKLPFFCVHPGNGDVLGYATLANYLQPEYPFYALQDVLRFATSPHPISLKERASLYLQKVREIQPQGPYYLGGWSYGGHVVFEMAQQLNANNQDIAVLAILDTASPKILTKHKMDEPTMLATIFRETTNQVDIDPNIFAQKLINLSSKEQWRFIFNEIKRFKPQFTSFELSQLQRELQLFKQRQKDIIDYIPKTYNGKITLFRSKEHIDNPIYNTGLDWGWNQLATEATEVHVIPGYHETITSEPNVQVLARHLKNCLKK